MSLLNEIIFLCCCSFCLFSCSVPALPVKNLTGSGPFHPALAGQAALILQRMLRKGRFFIDDAFFFPPLVCLCVCVLHICIRYDRYPDVRCRFARLSDPGPQAHTAPSTHQQERHEACSGGQRYVPQNQEEAPEER